MRRLTCALLLLAAAGCGKTKPEETIKFNMSVEDFKEVGKTRGVRNFVGARKADGKRSDIFLDPGPGKEAEMRRRVTWEGDGVVVDPEDKLTASVPVDKSVVKEVTVLVDGKKKISIKIWPVWVELGETKECDHFRGDCAQGKGLSPNNQSPLEKELIMEGRPSKLGIAPDRVFRDDDKDYSEVLNVMELRGDVSPAGVSSLKGVQFDFKRVRMGKIWDKAFATSEWELDQNIAAGTNDDESNEDEDLHDMNDVIWSNDSPGPITEFQVFVPFQRRELNFTEHVVLVVGGKDNTEDPAEGDRVSDDFKWHSIISTKPLGAGGGKSRVARDAAGINKIKVGHTTIGNQPQ